MDLQEHRKLAIEDFNKTWDLIDKENRTEAENEEMIRLAQSSRFHWDFVGSDLNRARGEWQISRVYSILNQGENALLHAQASLKYVEQNNYGDFDLVFAYEAMAYAYKVLGNDEMKRRFLKLGYDSLNQVVRKEDRDYCESELNNIQKMD